MKRTGRNLFLFILAASIAAFSVRCGDDGGGGDRTPPRVLSTSPVSDAADVPITTTVQVVFNEEIDEGTLSGGFTVSGGGPVDGSITYADQTATFTPSGDLAYDTTYSATVSQDVTDLAGNPLEGVYGWTFSTEAEPGNPPAAPADVTIAVGDGQLTLDWSLSTDATSYNLYWSETAGVTAASGTRIPGVTGPYTHTGLTNGTTYYYVVTAENQFGESAESMEVSGTPEAGATPPLPPDNVTATPGDAQVTLDWDPAADATSYNIYWSTTSGVDRFTGTQLTTNASPYVHTNLTNDTTYYYVVTSVNAFGESVESIQVSATPSDTGNPPAAPTNVQAAPGDTEVTITWDPVADATSYNIYWATATGVTPATGTAITGITSPYTHTGLTNDTAYYYIVTAENANGESVASAEVTATPTAGLPAAPANVSAAAGDAEVTVSWDPVTDATSYNIYWATTTGVTPATGTQIAGATSPHTHTGLTNGTTYYYVVTAVSPAGEGPPSAEASATPLPPLPTAPANVAAAPGDTQVQISWDTVTGATTYNIYWDTSSGVTPATGTQIAGVTSPYPHTGLTNGTTYYYVVTAENAAGEGPASGEVSAVPNPGAPLPPTGVLAVGGDGSVTVTWNPVADATSYNLYWSTNPAVDPTNGTRVTGATSPFVHSGLTNDVTYYYVVTSENTWGEGLPSATASATPGVPDTINPTVASTDPANNVVGVVLGTAVQAVFSEPMNTTTITGASFTLSDGGAVDGAVTYEGFTATFTPSAPLSNSTTYTATITTTALDTAGNGLAADYVWAFRTHPVAPTNLVAIAGRGEATLTWNAVTGATEYLIYRATTSGGPYSISGHSIGPCFTNGGLANDSTTYYFVVTAITADGESPYSNEANVRPMASLLSTPTGLRAIGRNAQVTLTWNEVAADVDYEIYRSTSTGGPYTNIATVALSEGYTDRGLTNGTTYYYVTRTVSGAIGSAYSEEVHATPSAALPDAPTGLSATPGSTWAALDWNSVSGALRYILMRSTTPNGPYSVVAHPTGLTHDDTGLINGTTYYYVVAATNASGIGALSSEISTTPLDTLPPQTPTLRASRGDGEVICMWNAVAGAASYRLLRSTTSGGPYSDLGAVTPPYSDSSVTNGTTYFYVLRALSSGLGEADSAEVSATPSATLPPAPTGVIAHPGNSAVTVTWDPVAGATSYLACKADAPGGPYGSCGTYTGLRANFTAFTENGTTYYFAVKARFGNLESAYSSEASATPQSTLPATPSGVYIEGGNTQLTVGWNGVSGATGFQVHRRTATSGWSLAGSPTSNSFTDTGLTNGTEYIYSVVTVNANGTGGWSNEIGATPSATAPVAPTGASAHPGNSAVTVTWDPVVGASFYVVCKADAPGGPYGSCGTYTGLRANFTAFTENGTTYYFAVKARFGNLESAYSPEASATPLSTLPATPSGVYIEGGNTQLTVGWNGVSGATGFQVHRRTATSGWSLAGSPTSNSFTDTGLTNGTEYIYSVVTVNANGTGGWSNEIGATPSATAPVAPTGASAHPGNSAVTVTWDPVVGASSYVVCKADAPGGPYGSCGTYTGLRANFTAFTDNGNTYYFIVKARTGSEESAYSPEASATPLSTLPATPSGVYIEGGNTQLTVGWNGVSGATGFQVHRRTATSGWSLAGSPTSNFFTDTGLTNGTEYIYSVVTVNANGTGGWSNEIGATPSASAPVAPTGVCAHPGNSAVTVTWDPVAGATSYLACKADAPGGPYGSCGTYTGLRAHFTAFTENGTTYYFAVKARVDTVESAYSPEASATPQSTLPATPTGVSIASGDAQLAVSWNSVSGAIGYQLYRRTAGSGWAFVADTAATSFIDTGLTNGTTYTYCVSAVNAAGEGTWSNEQSETPN